MLAILVRSRGRPVLSGEVGLGRNPRVQVPSQSEPHKPATNTRRADGIKESSGAHGSDLSHFWKTEMQEKTSL